MKRVLRSVRWCLIALSLPASVCAADVLVVDEASGPGADFVDLVAAVAAASSGDTILVRDGEYDEIVIDGKSLTLIADGEDVRILARYSRPTVDVRNLVAGQQVTLRGFKTDTGMSVSDSQGSVWFDEIEVDGQTASCSAGGIDGVSAEDAAAVTITRCTLRGQTNDDLSYPIAFKGDGLSAVNSTVQVYDSLLEGGAGRNPDFFYVTVPQPGGAGARIDNSVVSFFGCTAIGGPGGVVQWDLCAGTHANGGPGVAFVNATAILQSAESTATGGTANLTAVCPGLWGPSGPAIIGTGQILPLPGFARQLQANSPVRGGETLAFEIEGQPGETPILFVSPEHRPFPLASFNGVLLVGDTTDLFVVGTLPASGQAEFSFPVPNIGAATGALTFFAQAIFLDPAPGLWLGAGTTVVLLDPVY